MSKSKVMNFDSFLKNICLAEVGLDRGEQMTFEQKEEICYLHYRLGFVRLKTEVLIKNIFQKF